MSEQNQLEYKEYSKKRNQVVVATTDYQLKKLDKMAKQLPKHIEKRAKQFAQEYNDYLDSECLDDPTRIPLHNLVQHTFQPLIRVGGKIPAYSADQLAIALDFYCDCSLKLNQTGLYIPKKTDFCRMLGISTDRFEEMKSSSPDENVREICKQLEDYCVSVLADASLSERVEKVYAMFHQKSSNKQRDNDPVQNNTFIATPTILSDSQFNDLARKYQGEE